MSFQMFRALLGAALISFLVIACDATWLTAQGPSTSDGSGAFATGHYRNLFSETGHSHKEISRKVNVAFQQLFHGDPQTQSVFFWTGKNGNGRLAYVTDWNTTTCAPKACRTP
jgi:hypothetical protein